MPTSRRPSPARGRTTRGPLPPGVYWRRRLFVLGTAFALVFVIARWLSAGSDGRSDEKATDGSSAGVSASTTITAGAAGDPAGGAEGAEGTEAGDTPPPEPVDPMLIPPEGACAAADVLVAPSVAEGAIAGRDVLVSLSLQTRESPACTWQLSRDTVVVKVARKGKDVWTTRQCPKAIPEQPVVVRQAVATVVQLTWSGRESNDSCAKRAGWALPGTFTIASAALGGEPAEAKFTLGAPAPETIQVTPKEKKTKKAKKPKTPVN